MCGIAGITFPEAGHIIRNMTATLRHRGPDGEGFFENDLVALGHRRLSIIDLEGGAQPIANEDETLHLICNGEIYNSPGLREELQRAGHQFRTHTDVEVILHLYEEHGVRCVRYLQGMFAFAIWDERDRSLFLARDHLGQKPLYFCADSRRLIFASEVKAILATGQVAPELDLEGLWHYMSLRFLPDHYTLFRKIQKLPAASTLHWKDGRIAIDRYWKPDFTTKLSGSEKTLEDSLDRLLRDTVKGHLLSDVEVGAFLSGGIDSGTIAAIMASLSEAPVPTFSIGVKEQGFNELPFAHMVAERYGMRAHESVVSADLVHLMPRMIHHMDEPSDPFGVGVYLVSELAAQHVKVVLGGDGGDENFAGYDRFAGQRLAEYYSWLPAWVRRQVVRRIADAIPETFGYKSVAQKVRWLNEMSFHRSGERYYQSMSFLRFTHEAKEQLFTETARQRIGDWNSGEKITRFFDAENVNELIDRMLYTDLMTRMPDHLLMIVDRMSMAHSLETRSPLIDFKLVEFAAGLPGRMKLKGVRLKYLLRKVANRYLPSEVVKRPKQGFGFPLGIWMRTDLRHFMQRLFAESRLVSAGVFDAQFMQKVLEEHLSGQVDHNYRLWILINLEFWYRHYFEHGTIEAMQELTDRLMVA